MKKSKNDHECYSNSVDSSSSNSSIIENYVSNGSDTFSQIVYNNIQSGNEESNNTHESKNRKIMQFNLIPENRRSAENVIFVKADTTKYALSINTDIKSTFLLYFLQHGR